MHLLIDIAMFNVKYLSIHKMQMHGGAIRNVLYGMYICTEDNPLAKARGFKLYDTLKVFLKERS